MGANIEEIMQKEKEANKKNIASLIRAHSTS